MKYVTNIYFRPAVIYHEICHKYTGRPRKKLVSELLNLIKGALLCWMFKFSNALLCWMIGRWWLWRFSMTNFVLPKNCQTNAKMWKCKILDTFSMTFWLRTKFLGPAKIQNWTSGSVLEIPNSWLLVVEGAAELCRLILLISDHPIQQGYYKFWNQLFSCLLYTSPSPRD